MHAPSVQLADRVDADEQSAPADDPEPGSCGRLTIDVTFDAPDVQPPADGWLGGQLAKAADHMQLTAGHLSLAVVDDEAMTRLHEQYRNEAGTTDVLTFDLRTDAGDDLDGEVVVCIDEAARQAEQHDHETRVELLLYAVHGLLHLLGYDDQDADAYRQMHRVEDEVLAAIGIGPVFRKDADST